MSLATCDPLLSREKTNFDWLHDYVIINTRFRYLIIFFKPFAQLTVKDSRLFGSSISQLRYVQFRFHPFVLLLVNTKFFSVLSITLHFLLFFLLLFEFFISMFPYLGIAQL
ncbi:hypothetical protein RCL_jg262.t1 [Rhizophagus clarus]|uniref:Uncharacterized protein n=1 Tax=Rhizophagus clarus TaxID=94130 RepID=A0A8H3R0G8_9GLOM|nr:hypothetical protein RCL_jg262.t1 [Rhizophagus clarus]